ncbi:hypothetical protein NDR87_33970 [Nocardia sp. CDC159]|uniref:Uncharacterized protein n=1 Tax=Nocardia pulmonis TaxID=2951408 RepID=A0A9X2EDU8_9NOCA|nr:MULTISPECIES: hypothetical protein [Nocardia]MCM6778505.1 hypothetical protein [Nocardia pulmonis]MCM6791394.1 hypothetical protein [Nocardia sp. CDC159]
MVEMSEAERLQDLRRRAAAAGVPGSAEMTPDELREALGKMAKGADAETAKREAVEQ